MSQLGGYVRNVRDLLVHHNAGQPSSADTFFRRNMDRLYLQDSADGAAVPLTTQVMTSVPVYLEAGETVTNLSFISGATAAGTPTNYWFALYSSAATPALLAQTADQTSTAWAANTVMTVALATAQTISTTGIYWAAVMVKATTVPSLIGCIGARKIVTGERNLGQTSGSSLAATAPATIASATQANFVPYVVIT